MQSAIVVFRRGNAWLSISLALSFDSFPRQTATMRLRILNCGSCETFKAGVHGTALGLAAVMGLYNAAAWLRRREPHLAVNAILYAALTAWEHRHVSHHLRHHSQFSELPAATPPGTSEAERISSDTVAA